LVKEEKLDKHDIDFTLLSEDKRFEDLTGQKFGNLKILGPYKKEGGVLKWVAECSCGNIVKTTRSKLKFRGKTSCVDCSELKLREKQFTPVDIKIKDLLDDRKDLKIVKIHGETWADNWSVICTVCKGEYTRRYRDLRRGVKDCGCSKHRRKKLENKLPVVMEYCERWGFTFLGWGLEKRTKLNLYCHIHDNHLKPLYENIDKNQVSCKQCRKDYYTPYNLKTQEQFILDAVNVHGDSKFDYSMVEYINSNNKVKIKCNSCGVINHQTPAGHLSGRGCIVCSKTGYKPEEPCWVYIMKLVGLGEVWYKIGITKNLKIRLYNMSLGSCYNISYLDFKYLDKGYKAKRIEKLILDSLETKGTIDTRFHSEGVTEIFKPNELYMVESLLEEYYLEEVL
jgi:hypothetical protein